MKDGDAGGADAGPPTPQLEHDLAERRKELSLLHAATGLLHSREPLQQLLELLIARIPAGFQYPERTIARVRWAGGAVGDDEAAATRSAKLPFGTTLGGELEVGYTGPDPPEFLPEEEALLLSLREIVHAMIAQAEQRRLQEALHVAQRMEAIGRLAGGVAHDFNNLLTAIIGYTSALLDDTGPADPRREDLREIDRAASRAAELTQQLLAFSRRQVFQPVALDLGAVVRELTGVLAAALPDDVVLSVRIAADPIRVRIDRAQIEQVLLNLVLNARDAMPSGGRLDVEVRRGEGPNDPCTLTVADTGIGMDAETLATVFEPFFTTRPFHGTGLGLSSVYGIIEQSGGRIEVQSTPGQGSRFTVSLPALTVEPELAPVPQRPAQRGRATILVVEDDPQVRRLTARTLRREGYEVVEARDGRDALDRADQLVRLDLLLTDVLMPELSGPELAERLRARIPGLRVLFMSGYAADMLGERPALVGELPLLHKPFAPAGLAERVRQALHDPSAITTRRS